MKTPVITIIVVCVLIAGFALALYDYKKRGLREEKLDFSKTEAASLKRIREQGDEQFYKQNYEEAIEYYKRALKMWPRDAHLHNDLGAAYYRSGLQSVEPPLTEDEFGFGLEVDARYSEGAQPLDMVKDALKKIDSGIITAVVSDEAASKDIETYILTLGHYVHVEEKNTEDGDREFWLTIIKGKTKEAFLNAEREYRKAIDIKAVKDVDGRRYSNYSTASRNLGTLYFRMGRKKEAIEQWRRALQLEPTDAELRNLLGKYE